ncbi:hypothetical protein [Parasphingorhabdus sp.]|uniref:hypothetical protein n=1 Tax=Parasphingorhabdus sp. TaxID=2709688 RepID=UPI002F95B6FB
MTQSNDANPRGKYGNPSEILNDNSLDHDTKLELLQSWQSDVDHMLESESEGMGAEDPMSAERESSLAEEAQQVSKALETLLDKAEH